MDKKAIRILIFLAPAGIFLTGVIVCIVLPGSYQQIVSLLDWLFANPQDITDILFHECAIVLDTGGVVGIRVFWYVWIVFFIVSLFFLGKQLHSKPKPNAKNAILTKKEPYFMIQNVNNILKNNQPRGNHKELDLLIYRIKCLEEKLSVESDFGYGNDAVINCENKITKELKLLLDIITNVDSDFDSESIQKLNTVIGNINLLLHKRTELKKR